MAHPRDHDDILFRQLQHDDRRALDTLFRVYYQKLCTFADTYLNNREAAEECVADVFVALWKSRKHLIIEKSVKAYLYTSTKYAAFAHLRRRLPMATPLDDVLDDFLPEPYGIEQQLAYTDLEASMQAALQHISPRCRQVFLMSRMEGMSYKEISTILELSESTVEKHMVKALDALRTTLARYRPVKTDRLP